MDTIDKPNACDYFIHGAESAEKLMGGIMALIFSPIWLPIVAFGWLLDKTGIVKIDLDDVRGGM